MGNAHFLQNVPKYQVSLLHLYFWLLVVFAYSIVNTIVTASSYVRSIFVFCLSPSPLLCCMSLVLRCLPGTPVLKEGF